MAWLPPLDRRGFSAALLAATSPLALGQNPAPARKVLRVAFTSAETTFDPARIIDLYSRTVCSHIFEALYGYDHLARPSKFKPVLADGMPEVSADFKAWTIKLKRGVFFPDDEAFKGRRRELVAEDVLYAFRRVVDPANKSPGASSTLDEGIVGLEEAHRRAIDSRKPFDYDAPIEGMKALDSHSVRFTLKEPRPRFIQVLAAPDIVPAQAREAVEHYGERNGEHPLGTGPFRLKSWVRSSKIVLERNPHYREVFYDVEPGADDAEGQAIQARFKGRRLPLVDEVQVSVIQENQPLYLAFLNAELDLLAANTGALPIDFAPLAVPNGKLAPNLAKRHIQLYRTVRADAAMMYFNMEDPLVGGYTPDKVALRRAISLGYDIEREIRLVRRGQAIVAQSPLLPHTTGYDPAFHSPASEFNPAKARALLDMYGYVDRDGDGWREQPDGAPLQLTMSTEPQQIYRQFNDIFRSSMKAINLRCVFEIQEWPKHMKQALAGSLQLWQLGSSADVPDGQSSLARLYGPQAGQENLARFKLKAFDELYLRLKALPDGPERDKLFLEAKRIAAVYLPYRNLVHRMANELAHPWVSGYRRAMFWNEWWHMVDVDMDRRAQG